MADRVYKKITVVGCSTDSYQKAIETAIEKAKATLHGLSWFEVKEFRGGVDRDGEVEWQATVEVGFRLD